jgi:osmotically-inducible protein OsmY
VFLSGEIYTPAMKLFLGLILLAALAVGGWWYFSGGAGQDRIREAKESLSKSASDAQQAVHDKLHDLNFSTDDLKEELARTGQVVREKARELGSKAADATVDARVTATIKGKLVADSGLSGLNISVSTTDGVVTLSGRVRNHDEVKKAMDLALATDGCNKVISTLQVKE